VIEINYVLRRSSEAASCDDIAEVENLFDLGYPRRLKLIGTRGNWTFERIGAIGTVDSFHAVDLVTAGPPSALRGRRPRPD